ncbi:Pyruvate/2-oxoglutarate dehydrogenase complex, dihydrolipoamide dehydrogenase (E3) component [Dyadobacter soli]|uniref:Pyruvate/2-oxoglutarate dehydrogenase complex, dihydrolipoamide dehydrogenase (E3) component n=1 Tax=Dyadobacter soli TaxID=659014 RepID=A0A1G6W1Y1_9BACT|nr:mercuric reductase [Dyadobacter soli]SDD59950.1 Pyruvate/2-oxoglutarate dehydrogenase complex, dihydrolipoamide dehydrogenase (E3) component [Dyadobacter soli]
MKHYDAIVIGAGQAGTPLCRKLAKLGLKTALIEKRWVGGTCVNDGCSPTKAMVASAKAAWSARHNETLGVHVGGITVDFDEIIDRKNSIVHMMRGNSEKRILDTAGLDLIYGTARFSGRKEITVSLPDGGTDTFTADKFFLNTGLKPVIPDIEGIHSIPYLTSTTIMELTEIPEHLLILGSGYIALEFGQMFTRFGSKVTIIEPSKRILKREDSDIAEEVTKILAQEDIEIITGTKAAGFSQNGHIINVTLETEGIKSQRTCTHVLVAAGRKPQLGEFGLEVAGIEVDKKGYIKVNAQLETSAEGIYALGDVKGGPAFTHISYDDYRQIIQLVVEKKQIDISDRLVPYCMFIDPQLGRVGITEQEAREKGLDIKVAVLKNDSVARSIETGDERGMMKAIIDAKTGAILGAAVLAEQGGEIVTILQMAMMGGITYDRLLNGVFAHPTYAESLNNLFMTLE